MVLNGYAFSPPLNISPSSPGGSQPGSPQNAALNGTPQPHQPVEVVDAAGAVVGDPVLVGARTHGDVEECRHVLDGIVETAGLLQRRAAAEVNEPACHGRSPAPAAGSLQHQDVGAGGGGLDGRGRTGDPVSGDDDVGFVVPVRYPVRRNRVDVGAGRHGRNTTGSSPVHWWPQ